MKLTDLAWLDDAKTEGPGIQSAHRILFDKSFERRSDSAFALYRREWNRRPEQRFVGEFPMNLDTELDANCNLFCPMCARQSDPAAKAKGQMTLERFEKIVKEASAYAGKDWFSIRTNFRGESTMNPALEKCLKMAKEYGCVETGLNTNGNFSTARLRGMLEYADLIAFSLDALYPSTYGKIRVRGDFNLAYANVHTAIRLRDEMGLKTIVRVSFVHQILNDSEIGPFLRYWTEAGVDKATANLCFNPLMQNDREDYQSPYVIEQDPGFVCAQPWQRMAIWATGEIQPCCGAWLDAYRVGHIDADTVRDSWLGSKMTHLREVNENHLYQMFPMCSTCGVSQNKVIRRKDASGGQ